MFHSVLFLALVAAAGAFAQTPTSTADDWLKKAQEQYQARQYQEARHSFEEASRADPKNVEAKIGLANACMKLWVSGKGSPDRENNYFRARNTLIEVLDQQPDNQKALLAMSKLSLQRAMSAQDLNARPESLDEARQWNVRLIALDPNAVGAHYALGVIAWMSCLGPESQSHNPQNIPPSDSGVPPVVQARLNYRAVCQGPIEEGIANLKRVVEIEKDNFASMGYLGALYGMRAGYEDSPEEAQRDHASSEEWAAKAEAVKQAKVAAANATAPSQ
jgi:tetratricopeptide (TPR) repeat protein